MVRECHQVTLQKALLSKF